MKICQLLPILLLETPIGVSGNAVQLYSIFGLHMQLASTLRGIPGSAQHPIHSNLRPHVICMA